MRYLKDIGFVIKRVNLGESDKFISLFTKEHGKIEVLAKGVRRINSRRSSHIELLNLIKFQTVKTSKNYILTEVEVDKRFENSKKNLDKVSAVFLICELIDRLCPIGQKNEKIYELIKRAAENLEENDTSKVLFDFQVELLIALGFWDSQKQFNSEQDLKNFIENILEKKIRTKVFFNT